MAALLPAIVPISLIVLIGFIAGKTLNVESHTLSKLTIYILFPALIATSLSRTELSLQSSFVLVLGFALTSFCLYLLVSILSRWCQLTGELRKSLIATTLFANTGNLGLPFVTFALGAAAMERAIVYLVASGILMSSVAPALLKGKGIQYGLKFTIKLPIFWAMLLGLVLRLLDIQLPLPVDRAIEMLSQAAIPIALLTLGLQLSQAQWQFGRYEIFAVCLRLGLAPLIAFGIGLSLGLEALNLQVLIVQGSMPTAVTSLIWVNEFGGDALRVANTIVLSTIVSILTLPIVVWLIEHYLHSLTIS